MLDPAALDARGRQVLLDGRAPRLVADAARQAAEAALRATPGDRVIGRPAALADPIRRQLAAALPPGLALGEVSVRVDVPPEQARTAALAAVRRAAVPPLARVLYLGLDGMDWEILGPLIARGEPRTWAGWRAKGSAPSCWPTSRSSRRCSGPPR